MEDDAEGRDGRGDAGIRERSRLHGLASARPRRSRSTSAGNATSGASELIKELAHAKGTGFGLTDSQQEVETETLDALRTSVATLTAKAPDELGAYRELVVGIATSVAEAKGGVTEVEAATIAKLEEALGTS